MWLTDAGTEIVPRLNGEAVLIKLDIINEVVNRTGITKTKAEMAVETVFESMKKALESGDRIELRGFGVFNVKPRKTGIGRNPRTGAEVSIPPGTRERYWLYALLFALTLVTTCRVGAAMQNDFERNVPFELEHSLELWDYFGSHPAALLQGLPYSLTLLLILLAHEFGHYLAAVFHQVDSSLPFFLPSPILGTFGACL